MGSTAGEPLANKSSLSVTFNNLPQDDIADRVLVQVFSASGDPLPEVEGTVSVDSDGSHPAGGGAASGTWPAGARVTITIDGEAADALGMRMTAAPPQSFQVSP